MEVTCNPHDFRIVPILLAMIPFPIPEMTPPVTRMYFICLRIWIRKYSLSDSKIFVNLSGQKHMATLNWECSLIVPNIFREVQEDWTYSQSWDFEASIDKQKRCTDVYCTTNNLCKVLFPAASLPDAECHRSLAAPVKWCSPHNRTGAEWKSKGVHV